MKKNILVLSNYDETGQGHGWSQYKRFEALGYNVDFICLIRTKPDTKKYIIDELHPYNIRYQLYCFFIFICKLLFAPFVYMRWYYKGIDFANSKDILRKLSFKPDYIIITTYYFFLSPKSIYDLWKRTGATIVFIMTDEKILGGGCSYPINCSGYETGCRKCPKYQYASFIPRNIFKQKDKYFTKIPFHLVGSRYDLEKARKTSFLKDKKMHKTIGVPLIPFVKDKITARKEMGLEQNDFIILAGAVSLGSKEKGFEQLYESIKLFSKNIDKRHVTLLIACKDPIEVKWPENIKIVKTGFLDLNGLFRAFYACDIFLSPSMYDSGPYMVNYSIACGRPVVAFNIGIALDLVITKKTGWIAELNKIKDLAIGINYFYNLPEKEIQIIEENCKKHINSFAEHPWHEFMV